MAINDELPIKTVTYNGLSIPMVGGEDNLFVVNFTLADDNETVISNKTYAEVFEAANAGKYVVGKYNDSYMLQMSTFSQSVIYFVSTTSVRVNESSYMAQYLLVQLVHTGECYLEYIDSPLATDMSNLDKAGEERLKELIVDGQIQSDWNQTDESAVDFIKNKPFGYENILESPRSFDASFDDIQCNEIINGEVDNVYVQVTLKSINTDERITRSLVLSKLNNVNSVGYEGGLNLPNDTAYYFVVIGITEINTLDVYWYADPGSTCEFESIDIIAIPHKIDRAFLPKDAFVIELSIEDAIQEGTIDSDTMAQLAGAVANDRPCYINVVIDGFDIAILSLIGKSSSDYTFSNTAIGDDGLVYGLTLMVEKNGRYYGYISNIDQYLVNFLIPQFEDMGLISVEKDPETDEINNVAVYNVNDLIDDKIATALGSVESTLQSIYGGVL